MTLRVASSFGQTRPSEAIISRRKGYRASKGENAILGRVWLVLCLKGGAR